MGTVGPWKTTSGLEEMHGHTGLLHLLKDARKLTVLCLRLSEHRSDRDFLIYRLHLIAVCVLLSFLESVPRVVCNELPHFFARFCGPDVL